MKAHKTGKDGHHEYLLCDLILQKEGIVSFGLLINLPKDIIKENEDALHRGEWYVNITGATVEEMYIEGHGMVRNRISVPYSSTITTVSPDDGKVALVAAEGSLGKVSESRRLQSNGVHTLMVLRVSVSDSTPSFNASQLAKDYFDINSFSLSRQYDWCSFGAIQFVPYDSSNPVVDVVVPVKAANITSSNLWPLAMTAGAVLKQVNYLTDLTMHIAIVLPPGLADGNTWYAIGTVGYWW